MPLDLGRGTVEIEHAALIGALVGDTVECERRPTLGVEGRLHRFGQVGAVGAVQHRQPRLAAAFERIDHVVVDGGVIRIAAGQRSVGQTRYELDFGFELVRRGSDRLSRLVLVQTVVAAREDRGGKGERQKNG